MKTKIILVLAAIGLIAGAVYMRQSMHDAKQHAQLAALKSELDLKTQELQDLEARKELLNRQRADLLRQAQAQAEELEKKTTAQGTGAASSSASVPAQAPDAKASGQQGLGGFLAKMMEDPETRKFMRQQQQLIMDQMYAPLIKQLNLTPEEADKFKGILADSAMRSAERATTMFGAEKNARNESMASLAEETRTAEEQIKELLGESRFAQYKDYQQTAGDRMQLNMFKQQAGGDALTLTDSQTEQLLGLMKEERQALAAVGQTLPGIGHDAASLEAMMSQDQTEVILGMQESVNERVYGRAKDLLSEDQLSAFGKFQSNQLQLMRVGMGMARKMLAPEQP